MKFPPTVLESIPFNGRFPGESELAGRSFSNNLRNKSGTEFFGVQNAFLQSSKQQQSTVVTLLSLSPLLVLTDIILHPRPIHILQTGGTLLFIKMQVKLIYSLTKNIIHP